MSKGERGTRTEFGKALAHLRVDDDETGAEMAKKLGITASQMSALEYGRTQPTAKIVVEILDQYGKDLWKLANLPLEFDPKYLTPRELEFLRDLEEAVSQRQDATCDEFVEYRCRVEDFSPTVVNVRSDSPPALAPTDADVVALATDAADDEVDLAPGPTQYKIIDMDEETGAVQVAPVGATAPGDDADLEVDAAGEIVV